MRMSKLVGRRIKEDPKDAKTPSHKFLLRGGYARMVSAGIYSLLPIGRRVTEKIEAIIREEMNAIEGQEILMPVVLPAELWQESGRYESVGQELLRFKDRNGKALVLAMTHEEAVSHLVRTEINSYKQMPSMVYQIQTKYRDEARPRASLIRVREFTMKDAYSFHASQECLEEFYKRAHQAYENIFRRLGMKQVWSIESNSGMMGGKISHEFMAVSEHGEDTIFASPCGTYRANSEVATAAWVFQKEEELPLEKVHTPEKESIEAVANFLGLKAENTGKAVFYQDSATGELIFVLVRGDFEVNEAKLKAVIQVAELKFADDDAIRELGCVPGYASLLGIDPKCVKVIVDRSVAESSNLVVGANEVHYHYKNFNLQRDFETLDAITIAEIANVRAGDPCPVTGAPLEEKRGIEVGNIFQLGTKYSEAMGCNFLDKNGKSQPVVMGCYGIGVGRAMASVIEQCNDQYGPVWPMTIAPYQVHLCVLNPNKENVAEIAEQLYQQLLAAGIEVLYDDRGEKAGFMFNDADLIGVPLRLVLSPKTAKENKIEFKRRGSRDGELLDITTITSTIQSKISEEYQKFA